MCLSPSIIIFACSDLILFFFFCKTSLFKLLAVQSNESRNVIKKGSILPPVTFVRSKVQWIDAVSHNAMYSMQCFNTVQSIYTLHIFSLMGLFSSALEPHVWCCADYVCQTELKKYRSVNWSNSSKMMNVDDISLEDIWYLENLEMVGVQHSAHFSVF